MLKQQQSVKSNTDLHLQCFPFVHASKLFPTAFANWWPAVANVCQNQIRQPFPVDFSKSHNKRETSSNSLSVASGDNQKVNVRRTEENVRNMI